MNSHGSARPVDRFDTERWVECTALAEPLESGRSMAHEQFEAVQLASIW